MQRIVSLPWSPVRAPKVRPARRSPASIAACRALELMRDRENELAKQNRVRAIGGFAVLVGSCVANYFCLKLAVKFSGESDGPSPQRLHDSIPFALMFSGLLILITFPIAIFTRPRSRSDVVNQFLEHGTRSSGSNDNPFVRAWLAIMMLGLLYGEFLIVDAGKFLSLRVRLRDVDRHRVAVILQMLLADPRGIDPRPLLQIGETPLHLRHTLAYLMAYEWADISPQGDRLDLVSKSKRDLRNARKSLYAPSPA
jgi:hypothetical protein